MSKKVFNLVFTVILVVIMSAGAIRTVFFPKEINFYENRYAEKPEALTKEGWLDGSFQSGLDDALADQVNFSSTYKKIYNFISGKFANKVSDSFVEQAPEEYVNIMGHLAFKNRLVFSPFNLSDKQQAFDAKVENYNAYFKAFPDIEFYCYYVEKDTDIDFSTGQKPGASDYIYSKLELNSSHKGVFSVDSFDDFADNFYETDHHWNYKGSYKAYLEIIDMLGAEGDPIKPEGEPVKIGTFSGSKARSSSATSELSENFSVYKFDFPQMDVTITDSGATDYGHQSEYLANDAEPDANVSYGDFYGGDSGEVIFSTNQSERENILVIGESYDNAVLKLLASHYNNTYSVDLRNYEHSVGKRFAFSEYVREHDINKVLLIGNVDFYAMAEFKLEN